MIKKKKTLTVKNPPQEKVETTKDKVGHVPYF